MCGMCLCVCEKGVWGVCVWCVCVDEEGVRYSGCVSAAWHSSPPLTAAAHLARLLSTPSPLFSALCAQLIGLLQSSQLPAHW